MHEVEKTKTCSILASPVFSVSLGTDSQGDCLPDTTTGSITIKLNKGGDLFIKNKTKFQLALKTWHQ